MFDIDLMFVIPLAIGLAAVYVANQFDDEIADLGIVISIASLILAIVFAPWQLQLFLFVLVISVARWFWQSNGNHGTSDMETIGKITVPPSPRATRPFPNETQGKMVRKYRGVNYEVSVALEPKTREDIGGMYRGNPWTTKNNPGMMRVLFSPSDLKYRGVRWTLEVPPESQDHLNS